MNPRTGYAVSDLQLLCRIKVIWIEGGDDAPPFCDEGLTDCWKDAFAYSFIIV